MTCFLINFWWRQLAAGRSLNSASCRGGWGDRSCPRSATVIHSVAVDRTPNLPIGRRTLNHCAIADDVLVRCVSMLDFSLGFDRATVYRGQVLLSGAWDNEWHTVLWPLRRFQIPEWKSKQRHKWPAHTFNAVNLKTSQPRRYIYLQFDWWLLLDRLVSPLLLGFLQKMEKLMSESYFTSLEHLLAIFSVIENLLRVLPSPKFGLDTSVYLSCDFNRHCWYNGRPCKHHAVACEYRVDKLLLCDKIFLRMMGVSD